MRISFTILLFISTAYFAQKDSAVFSIDNCVSQFNMEETIPTKVEYQFWFVDKEF